MFPLAKRKVLKGAQTDSLEEKAELAILGGWERPGQRAVKGEAEPITSRKVNLEGM